MTGSNNKFKLAEKLLTKASTHLDLDNFDKVEQLVRLYVALADADRDFGTRFASSAAIEQAETPME